MEMNAERLIEEDGAVDQVYIPSRVNPMIPAGWLFCVYIVAHAHNITILIAPIGLI